MKPVAYRQMSSKWHCWVFEENRADLRPDDDAEALVLESDAQMLLAAARAALAYDAAIQSCCNDPSRMASFCTAEGDDIDALYAAWIDASRAAIAKATGGAA